MSLPYNRLSSLVVVGGVCASLVGSGWRVAHSPTPEALNGMADAVRQRFRQGDLVVVHPPYMVGPRQRLGDLDLWEPSHLRPDDLNAFSRVHWVQVDAIGAPPEVPEVRAVLDGLADPGQQWRGQGVTVVTYELPQPPQVAFDLHADLQQVAVSAHYADDTVADCDRWDRDRWVCPRHPEWSYVGREILDIDHQPRRCVWTHPLGNNGVLRVLLPFVADATQITGGFGFTARGARSAKAPVRLRLRMGQRVLLDRTRPVLLAWETYRLPLTHKSTSEEAITLEVSTPNNATAHFCVALTLTRLGS